MTAKSNASSHTILEDIEDRISELLDMFYEKIGKHHHGISGRVATRFEPPADVTESDVGLRILLELPGLDADDIEISGGAGVITVKGEKRIEHEIAEDAFHCRERVFGRFRRSVRLTNDLDADQASATFKNGILTITVPLKPEAERNSRKIEIKSA